MNRHEEQMRRILKEQAAYRDQLRQFPILHWLFFEITNVCNLSCQHCGSNCGNKGSYLSVYDIESVLKTIPDKDKPMICITGGEPLMHPDFYSIAKRIQGLGFPWGMTTNATLIDKRKAHEMADAGMSTVTVSLDGLKEAHDRLRNKKGAWKAAIEGIKNLQEVGFAPQVTSVVHEGNIHGLDDIYNLLRELHIRSWRLINVEPIGRACEVRKMQLSKYHFIQLLDFIKEKRNTADMEVTYGCSHYLGAEREYSVRDRLFMCYAGITVASVRSNGDICACLDIENRLELVQGNIHKDQFWKVWKTKFDFFRKDRTEMSEACRNCEERYLCGGDSTHTWDFENNQPLLCGKIMLSTQM